MNTLLANPLLAASAPNAVEQNARRAVARAAFAGSGIVDLVSGVATAAGTQLAVVGGALYTPQGKSAHLDGEVLALPNLSATPAAWTGEAANLTRTDLAYLQRTAVGAWSLVIAPGVSDMAAAGWTASASDPGLWTSGTAKAIPVALIQRRNGGAFDPVYNPNGAWKYSDGQPWHATAVTGSAANCFASPSTSASGRPDGLTTALAERDVKRLLMEARRPADLARILEREVHRIVAGETRGWEGIPRSALASVLSVTDNGTSLARFDANVTLGGVSYRVAQTFGAWVGSAVGDNSTSKHATNLTRVVVHVGGVRGYLSFDGVYTSAHVKRWHDNTIITDLSGDIWITLPGLDASNTPLCCDIIGSPANYPASWLASGVMGAPLTVDESGAGCLPDASRTAWKLSRKASALKLVARNGSDDTANWAFSATPNVVTRSSAPAATDVIQVFYEAKASLLAPAATSEVLAYGDVWCGDRYDALRGASLVEQLIGKVPVGVSTVGGYEQRKVLNISINPQSRMLLPISSVPNWVPPRHEPFTPAGVPNGPAVKILPCLTSANGKLALQLLFKELRHDGTDWGDDGKFVVVDNLSTTLDDNAATVICGQKRADLHWFWKE